MPRNPNRVSEGVARRIAEQNPYTDEGVELIFDYMKQEGQIPAKYKTSKSYFNTVSKLAQEQNITPTRAASILYQRNFLRQSMGTAGDAELAAKMALTSGYQGFPLKMSSKGVVSFDARAIRDSIPKHLKSYFNNLSKQGILPPNSYERYVKNVENHWNKLGKENALIRDKTGKVYHRGHTQSGKYGGPRGGRAVFRELGADNMSHAEVPRMLRHAAQELGIPFTWMEDAAYFILEEEGLSPTKVTPAMVDAVDFVKGGFRDPNEIIALRDQFQQQEAYTQQLAESRRVNPPPEFKPRQPAPGTGGRPQTVMSLVKNNDGTIRAASRLAAPAVGGLAVGLGLYDTKVQAQEFMENPTLTKGVGLGASVVANVTDALGFVPGPHTPAVESVGLAAEGLNLTMAERARQDAQGEPYFGPKKEEEQFDPNKTNYSQVGTQKP